MSKKALFIFSILFSFLITGCSKDEVAKTNPVQTSISDNEIFEDLNLTTSLKSTNLPSRLGFEIIEFKGEYWFIGGEEPFLKANSTYFNDVWKSSDGENWTKIVDNAPWKERSNFNLLEFDNKLWIIGGENENINWLNDVWSSDDGITWTQITDHGPWETRQSMSVNVHNNKMYLIGGHSITTWHLYQDIWESINGKDWQKVGSISDNLLGTESSRQGIYQHSIIKLKDEYFLIAGQLATVFTAHTRVLKSKDMINWETVNIDTPWKKFKYLGLGNLRPFVYKGNLILVVERSIEVNGHFSIPGNVIPAKHFVFSSGDGGATWEEELELDKLPKVGDNIELFMEDPRVLIIDEKINLYGSFQASFVNRTVDTKTHRFQLSNN